MVFYDRSLYLPHRYIAPSSSQFPGEFDNFSEVCFIVQRPFIYASHGGELKIYIDGNEIAIYPDGHFAKEKYCPEQIPDGARITFDAVTNDQVGCI